MKLHQKCLLYSNLYIDLACMPWAGSDSPTGTSWHEKGAIPISQVQTNCFVQSTPASKACKHQHRVISPQNNRAENISGSNSSMLQKATESATKKSAVLQCVHRHLISDDKYNIPSIMSICESQDQTQAHCDMQNCHVCTSMYQALLGKQSQS